MAAPYGTSRGLSKRPAAVGNSMKFSCELIRFMPSSTRRSMVFASKFDNSETIFDAILNYLSGLLVHTNIFQVAQEIESESKFQNDFLNQLQMTMIKAQAGVKNNMRRLNKSIIREGSNHVMHVVLFALLCFFVVYLCSKFFRR